ncbi:hypothetical protein C4J81_02040 [Deltaproteobacteria bacterium Smac51]|nr:hypothetical protein C4J81_02040 [Deltaproteobacteria bacterium Smac51]
MKPAIDRADSFENSGSTARETERQRLVLKPEALPVEQKPRFLRNATRPVQGKMIFRIAVMKPFRLIILLTLSMVILLAARPVMAEGELVRALKSREEFFNTPEMRELRHNWQTLIKEFEDAALAQEEPRHASRARFIAAQLSLASGQKYKKDEDYQNARTLARRAVRDCPRCAHSAEAQLIHGQALFQLKELDEADRQLMRVELNYPDSPHVATARQLLTQLRGGQPPTPDKPEKQPQAKPAESGKTSAEAADKAAKTQTGGNANKKPAEQSKPKDSGLKTPKKIQVPKTPKARSDGKAQVFFIALEDFGKYTRVTAYVDKVAPYVYNLIPPARAGGSFRAYADIKGAVIAPGTSIQLKDNSPLVKLVKMNQFQAEVVRLVIDMPDAHPYMPVFVDKPPRLVFNIAKEAKDLPANAPEAQPDPPDKKPEPASNKNNASLATKGATGSMIDQLGLKVKCIVLDPGHGGKDIGAGAFGLKEKDITLKLAKKLKTRLENRLGLTVHLTRNDDTFITLERRTKIAKDKKADIFISLHVNANNSASVQGFETYILNFATDKSAMAVAARENASSDKSVSELDDVLQSIAKNTKIIESRALAQALHKSAVKTLNKKYKVRDLGIKEAPFFVLVGANVPAVLAEIGFITNEAEAARIKTDAYLDQVADGLAEGLAGYVR